MFFQDETFDYCFEFELNNGNKEWRQGTIKCFLKGQKVDM